jgi:hypothetical protein
MGLFRLGAISQLPVASRSSSASPTPRRSSSRSPRSTSCSACRSPQRPLPARRVGRCCRGGRHPPAHAAAGIGSHSIIILVRGSSAPHGPGADRGRAHHVVSWAIGSSATPASRASASSRIAQVRNVIDYVTGALRAAGAGTPGRSARNRTNCDDWDSRRPRLPAHDRAQSADIEISAARTAATYEREHRVRMRELRRLRVRARARDDGAQARYHLAGTAPEPTITTGRRWRIATIDGAAITHERRRRSGGPCARRAALIPAQFDWDTDRAAHRARS